MSTPGAHWGKWFFSSIRLWYGHLEFCVPCTAPQGKEEINPRAVWPAGLRLIGFTASREPLSLPGLHSPKQRRIKAGRRTQLLSSGSWWMVREKQSLTPSQKGRKSKGGNGDTLQQGEIPARLKGKKCSVERDQPEHQRWWDLIPGDVQRSPGKDPEQQEAEVSPDLSSTWDEMGSRHHLQPHLFRDPIKSLKSVVLPVQFWFLLCLELRVVYQTVWILLSPQAVYLCLVMGGNMCCCVRWLGTASIYLHIDTQKCLRSA